MKLNVLWLLCIISLATNAQTVPTITIPAPVGEYFLDAYYKGQRDSILLQNARAREQTLLSAVAIRTSQVESYKRDSAQNVLRFRNMEAQKKNSVDSVQTVADAKIKKVKDRSKTKSFIIIGLILLFALK